MKIGILGAGNVAKKMMRTLAELSEVRCVAVGARDSARGEAFAKEFQIPKAYGSYEELLSDEEVDVIYVATPHSHHYEHMKLCIQYNKHILCEKAFTVSARQAKEVLALAKEKNLLVVEGMWTRFLPMVQTLRDYVASEKIGKITSLHISMCHRNIQNERVYLPELAGGTLLNLGCYIINFTSMIFGDEVKKIDSSAVMTDTGVDAHNSITFTYEDGRVATMHASATSVSLGEAFLYGEKGYISIPNAERIEECFVYDDKGNLLETLKAEPFNTGFEYQVLAMKKALAQGKTQCSEMPHDTIILMMERMDEIRKQWGLVYPCE